MLYVIFSSQTSSDAVSPPNKGIAAQINDSHVEERRVVRNE